MHLKALNVLLQTMFHHRSEVNCFSLLYTAQQCSTLFCTAVHCSALHYPALLCTSLQCTSQSLPLPPIIIQRRLCVFTFLPHWISRAVQYCVLQYSAVQYCVLQYSAVQCNFINKHIGRPGKRWLQCNSARFSTVEYTTMHCNTCIEYHYVGFKNISEGYKKCPPTRVWLAAQ